MGYRTQFISLLFTILLASAFGSNALAGDDSGRLAGEWRITVPINGAATTFDMTLAGSNVQVYVVLPSGNILVRAGNFTAVDGHYAEANTKPGAAQSADYTFPSDDVVRMTNVFGVFDWHRVNAAAPAAAAAPAPAPAAAPAPAKRTQRKSRAPAPQAPAAPEAPAASQVAANPAGPSGEPSAQPAASNTVVPWSSPQELADCVMVDTDLIDLATGKALASNWSHSDVHPVVGRNDLFYAENTLYRAGSPPTQIASKPYGQHDWIAPDMRRVVMIHDGDIWRGEFDWLHNTVINKKQLTNKGIFDGSSLLAWHDNIMYLATPISREKPVIRIDLLSGEFKQLPPDGITVGATTPDGRMIISPLGGHIMLYNVITGETGSMPSTLDVPGPLGQTVQQEIFGMLAMPMDRRDPREPDPWVGDEKGIVLLIGAGQSTYVLGEADFARGTSRLVALLHADEAVLKQVLPGKQFVDLQVTTSAHDQGATPAQTRRVLVSLADGKQTPMPLTDNGFWVDDHRFIYGIAQGDIDKLGAYVYSRTDGKTTQICQRPTELNLGGVVYLPHLDTIIFYAATPGRQVCMVKLDGSGFKQLAGTNVAAISGEPVDLGLGDSPKPIWQPVNESQAQSAMPTAAHDPNQPGDELTVRDAIKNLPDDEQKRAMNYYQGAIHSAPVIAFCDPAKVALKCLTVSRTQSNKEFGPIIQKLDLSDCVFQPSVERYATNMLFRVVNPHLISDEQKKQIVTIGAKEFTDKFMSNPGYLKNGSQDFLQQCYQHAEDQVQH